MPLTGPGLTACRWRFSQGAVAPLVLEYAPVQVQAGGMGPHVTAVGVLTAVVDADTGQLLDHSHVCPGETLDGIDVMTGR